ncbi:hypothetical protein [Marinoscillum sp.]|uniref:hypothetical protein n=1 Tax=Marinoscillum sp. TaxID=2024838 RepID=UPI003BA855EE
MGLGLLKESDWNVTCKRHVAFMDIMGFKELVAKKSHGDVLEILESLSAVSQIAKLFSGTTFKVSDNSIFEERIRTVTFSDTIMFFSTDDSIADLKMIVNCCQGFHMGCCVKQEPVPIKGSISTGLITADLEKSLFFGQPIIDAYQLQEQVHYYGIVADHSIDHMLHETEGLDNLVRCKTPLKGGSILHYNMRFDVDPDDLNKFYNTVSGQVRKYVDNTLDMYKLMHPDD